MDNSFFEYRDKTGVSDDSDVEVIDNSLLEDESFISKSKVFAQHKNVYIEESESSVSEVEDLLSPKSSSGRSSAGQSTQKSVSDHEEMSPEIVPRQKPLAKTSTSRSSDTFIGQRNKKRMILLDSDTDNSFVIEPRNRKMKCLKDTPERVNCSKVLNVDKNGSNNNEEAVLRRNSSEDESDHAGHKSRPKKFNVNKILSNSDSDDEAEGLDGGVMNVTVDDSSDYSSDNESGHESDKESKEPSINKRSTHNHCHEDDRANEVINLIETDSSDKRSANKSKRESDKSNESSINKRSLDTYYNDDDDDGPDEDAMVMSRATRMSIMGYIPKENESDDSNCIIQSDDQSVITLSSDDDVDEVNEENKTSKPKKSPNPKMSTKPKTETTSVSQRKMDGTIKQYLLPPSYPNQVVYVKKHVRENELSKLNGLQEDLQNIRRLLETMDVTTLPDGGVKLLERLAALEEDVRRQGDKVANMVVEPDVPKPEDIAKDGFSDKTQGLSWDDIQKVSNAVQPKAFSKNAMAAHVAERQLILEQLRDLHESLASRPSENEHGDAPKMLKTQLMPHQLHALAWLQWRETQRPPGGILADDMGLGKTITMISLVASDKERKLDDDDDVGKFIRGGTLVVCPASLVQQWVGEVSSHCKPHGLAVYAHHGPQRVTAPVRLAAHDMVITTYNILLRETEKMGGVSRVHWRRVILDEAHCVRNHKSQTAAAVTALRASRRWALTGTPLHNRDLDLFALLRFLHLVPFDDLAMWKKWIDNKSIGGQERMSIIMRCIMLRRSKAQLQELGQLASLPQRDLHDHEVTLTKDEMNVYKKLLVLSKTMFAQFLQQRAEKHATAAVGVQDKNNAYAAMHKRMVKLRGVKPVKSHEILVLVLRLRQVCCHCGLIASMLHDGESSYTEDPAEKDLLDELNKLAIDDEDPESKRQSDEQEEEEEEDGGEGATVVEAIGSVLSAKDPVFTFERKSSKILAVMECLRKHVLSKPDEKAVVVSQWTQVLRLVERELVAAKVRCVTLSGEVPVAARAPLVTQLNDPKSSVRVMLLSLCAGGVGLNLCGANHLLLLDPHWNPQLEEQAQDRIYRMGQTRHVHIYRFMCVDTVEQSIRKLQRSKLELAAQVLTGARYTNASKLSIDDLKMLFYMNT